MKYLIPLLFIVSSAGCGNTANANNPENMSDLASQLKDISASVDGTLKFSTETFTDSQSLLMTAINGEKKRLSPFEKYQLKIIVQGKNAVLLLCKENILLIEDAGCTTKSDIQHWKSTIQLPCDITLNTKELCKT